MGADYAVVGVGALAEAIVVGLSDGIDDAPAIVLSPRGAERSARLAARFANVTVAADNQAAVSAAPVVVVAVRPAQAEDVLESLTFTAEQHVVSVVAAVSLDRLRALVAPATDVTRTIPMPEVARRAGHTPVLPRSPEAIALLERLGTVVRVDDEAAFDAMSVATATVAAHLHYVSTIAQWLAAQGGISAADAEQFVAGVYQGLQIDVTHGPLADLATDHATPGGFNEGFDRALTDSGVFEAVTGALDAGLRRIHDAG